MVTAAVCNELGILNNVCKPLQTVAEAAFKNAVKGISSGNTIKHHLFYTEVCTNLLGGPFKMTAAESKKLSNNLNFTQ